MVLPPALKKEVMDKFKRSPGDTGSPEVQVALITRRIVDLAEHFKTHQSDHHSRQGLLRMVNKRRKLLDYIKQYNMQRYRELISGLGLRR